MNSLIQCQKQIFGLSKHHRNFKYASSIQTWTYKLGKYKTYGYENSREFNTFNNNANPGTSFKFKNYPFYNEFSVLPSITGFNGNQTVRYFSLHKNVYQQHSSKVEASVKTMKEKEKEKLSKEQLKPEVPSIVITSDVSCDKPDDKKTTKPPAKAAEVAPVVQKKTIRQKVWAELVHYYHGFRLLFIDINICRKLLWQVLNGQSLTRREHRLLIRTTSDLFRLVPFSVFIIVPFMEFLLPVVIKFFPGMLPSTFQTAKDNEAKVKQNLKVKIEMAKFLQKTLDEMSVQGKDHKSEEAKEFALFFEKIRTSGVPPTNEEIMKYSKLFEDEITLDSLNRQQLTALCRVLETSTLGTNNLLRFQLRMKLRSLAADDRMIQKEGIDSLNLSELQAACRSRGMRAYGISEERLKCQLQEWINLSLNEKVPPSLLLLSRAMMLPEHVPTSDKLKATISALPDMVVAQTKAAIGERQGKIDNKTKIEIIREEERKIKEEKDEQRESEKAAELLVDKAQIISTEEVKPVLETVEQAKTVPKTVDRATKPTPVDIVLDDSTISSKDMEVLSDALETLSKDTQKLIVEKEEIKDLKEEIADYKEDVEELQEAVTLAPENVDIRESKAAKNLFKKVNSMISKLEVDLARTEKKIKQETMSQALPDDLKKEELVHIDQLLNAVQQLQKVPDSSRLDQIQHMLDKFDIDQDGQIRVEDVLKVIETIGKENVKLNAKQVNELIDLINKEEILENEEKHQKAIAKSKQLELVDSAKTIVSASDEDLVDKTASVKKDSITEEVLKEAIEKQTEKILPQQSKIPPPQIPTSGSTKPKDKTL